MGILGLIILGAIVGFLADLLDKKHDNSWITNVVLGVFGAVTGGYLRQLLTDNGNTLTWDVVSFLWALGGTLLVLAVYHAFAKRRIDDIRNKRGL